MSRIESALQSAERARGSSPAEFSFFELYATNCVFFTDCLIIEPIRKNKQKDQLKEAVEKVMKKHDSTFRKLTK
jgi:hypothetical protein